MMRSFRSAAVAVVSGALAAIGLPSLSSCARQEAAAWEQVSGVRAESPHNDGDSVAVRFNGRTEVFRLYFVDTLETSPASEERLIRQAAAFGIPADRLDTARELAQRAKQFTREQTSGGVRLWTRWERVSPGSGNPSIRAFIEGRDGDLATLLVREGLAVIKSGSALSPHPDGRSAGETLAQLRAAESEARRAKRGGWAGASAAAPLPPGVLDAGDTAALAARTGQRAEVEGRVGRIGSLPGERIVFINFSGNSRSGFCAIIRKPALGRLRGVFGEGFPGSLEGRRVRITGQVTEHKGAPQIEITSPEQIRLPPGSS